MRYKRNYSSNHNIYLTNLWVMQDKGGDSAEVRIAKVAVTNVALWLLAWTPYASVAMIAQFGGASLVTPMVSQVRNRHAFHH